MSADSISALLRTGGGRPRAGDLRVLVEQAKRACEAAGAPLTGVLNSRILVAGASTSLLVLAAGVADAGSSLACVRVLIGFDADPGLVPSCVGCRGSAHLAVALRRRPGFSPSMHPGRDTFPLHAAAERGHAGVVEALLTAGEGG